MSWFKKILGLEKKVFPDFFFFKTPWGALKYDAMMTSGELQVGQLVPAIVLMRDPKPGEWFDLYMVHLAVNSSIELRPILVPHTSKVTFQKDDFVLIAVNKECLVGICKIKPVINVKTCEWQKAS